MRPFEGVNLMLRILLEVGVVLGFAYWGFHTGNGTAAKVLLGVGAPVVGFGFWGAIDFHHAGRAAEGLRLIQELGLSGLAALAWSAAGQYALGAAVAALSVIYHSLVYVSGERLLKSRGGLRSSDAGAGPRTGSAG